MKLRCVRVGLIALLALVPAHAALAQSCEPRPALHAIPVTGEAYGNHDLIVEAAPGLHLALFRALWGWRVAILDDMSNDLIAAAPVRGRIDPRDIYGWHFRNADNTADADSLPHERRFAFLISGDDTHASGSGWLNVDEYGLTALEPGEKARMNYLRFNACLTWPKTDEEIRAEADIAGLDFRPSEQDAMRACGLEKEYELIASFPPRMLNGDFDGDGAPDIAAFTRRQSDGRVGLAICRPGSGVNVVGLDGLMGSLTEHGDLGMIEAWHVATMTDVPTGWENEEPRPEVMGDVLVLERIEKALYSLYWDGERFRMHLHYRYVEP